MTVSIDEHLQRVWDGLPESARTRWVALRPERVREATSPTCRCKYGTCERCLRAAEDTL